jgi:hypothetical protein
VPTTSLLLLYYYYEPHASFAPTLAGPLIPGEAVYEAPANVSSRSVVKRLVVSEGREELTTKAATCLLLSSERGAGGVVVSKEEVVVGRKGSGGAWGPTSRNAGLAGPASQNGQIRTLWHKIKQKCQSWSWSRGKQVASCRSYLCSREGGPHTSPTPSETPS